MKVRELKRLIDRLDPEAEVLAGGGDLPPCAVTNAGPAQKDGADVSPISVRRAKKANVVLLHLGQPIAADHPDWQKPPHRQVIVRWGQMEAPVDEDLAPLILALWQRGILTWNSCQENRPGVAWVQFATAGDAQMFLDAVAVYPPEEQHLVNDQFFAGDVPFCETLYGRIIGCGSDGDWEYRVLPENWSVEETVVGDVVHETCRGPADFEFAVSVRFPRSDLPAILERLQSEPVPTGQARTA